MNAETLRRAATLIRERATAASCEPAYLDDPWIHDGGPDGDGLVWANTQAGGAPVAGSEFPNVAEYIASWHPAVALAVARLLETEATLLDNDLEAEPSGDALAVARAYLGVSA